MRKLILIGVLLLPAAAGAAWEEGLGLSAEVRRGDLDLRYSDGSAPSTRTTRLGITLYEQFRPWFRPGLRLGYLWTSQSGNPATQGLDLNGQYIGLTVQSRLLETSRLGLHGQASFTYLESEDSLEDRETRLRWYESELSAGAHLRLGEMELGAGGYVRLIEGDEIVRGETYATRDVEEDQRGGGYVSLLWRTDATGSVGARLEQGASRGIELSFSRQF